MNGIHLAKDAAAEVGTDSVLGRRLSSSQSPCTIWDGLLVSRFQTSPAGLLACTGVLDLG